MNHVTLFSVATPTLNALAKLRRCVGSVRGQQVDGRIRVEHLVQDALSTDGSAEWLRQQPDLHARSEPDRGMYDGINRAWLRSRGDVLSWLNSDEQYLPGTLASVDEFLAAHPEIDVVFGDYIVCADDGQPVALRREIPLRRLFLVNGFLYASSCTLFFRRRLLERGRLRFDETLRYASDKDLLLRLVASKVKIAHIPRYLALFSIDGTNLSGHLQARVEAEAVRRRHGAFRHPLARELVMAGRHVERLIRGCYARQTVKYRFAKDEVPNYLDVEAQGVGGRYALHMAGGR